MVHGLPTTRCWTRGQLRSSHCRRVRQRVRDRSGEARAGLADDMVVHQEQERKCMWARVEEVAVCIGRQVVNPASRDARTATNGERRREREEGHRDIKRDGQRLKMSQLTVLGQQSTNEWLGERMPETGGSGRVVFHSIHRRRASENGEI